MYAIRSYYELFRIDFSPYPPPSRRNWNWPIVIPVWFSLQREVETDGKHDIVQLPGGGPLERETGKVHQIPYLPRLRGNGGVPVSVHPLAGPVSLPGGKVV